MFTNKEFPKYLHATPIVVETKQPYAVLEPTTGEQIPPEQFTTALSERQQKIIKEIFRKTMIGQKTYIGMVKSLEDFSVKNPGTIGDTLHHLFEDENGDFHIGLQIEIVAVKPYDFDIQVATAFPVNHNPELFGEIYLEEDQGFVDDMTMLSVSATNAMSILAQNCDLSNPLVLAAVERNLEIHRSIDEYRWSGAACEIFGGIAAVIVMRRWGFLNSTGLTPKGIDENIQFANLVETLTGV